MTPMNQKGVGFCHCDWCDRRHPETTFSRTTSQLPMKPIRFAMNRVIQPVSVELRSCHTNIYNYIIYIYIVHGHWQANAAPVRCFYSCLFIVREYTDVHSLLDRPLVYSHYISFEDI